MKLEGVQDSAATSTSASANLPAETMLGKQAEHACQIGGLRGLGCGETSLARSRFGVIEDRQA